MQREDKGPKPENLSSLLSLVKSGNYDLGIAHDGDADRAVFIDENGTFKNTFQIGFIRESYCIEKARNLTATTSNHAVIRKSWKRS